MEKIIPEITLKETIAETREFAKAMNEFADKLEQIEKKYSSDVRVYADSGIWPPCRVNDDKTLEQGSCEDTAFWEWVPYDDDEHGDIVCSKCRAVEVECVWKYTAWAEIERIKYKHCPQCGAKITERSDKE